MNAERHPAPLSQLIGEVATLAARVDECFRRTYPRIVSTLSAQLETGLDERIRTLYYDRTSCRNC